MCAFHIRKVFPSSGLSVNQYCLSVVFNAALYDNLRVKTSKQPTSVF